MKAVKKVIADPLLKRFGMPNREELKKARRRPRGLRRLRPRLVRRLDPRRWTSRSAGCSKASRASASTARSLVVYTGDHGEEFLEHGRMFHGQTAYGELNKVPLILWRPGAMPAGRVVAETVRDDRRHAHAAGDGAGLPVPAEAQGTEPGPAVDAWAAPAQRCAPRRPQGEPALSEKAAVTGERGAPPPRDTESVAVVAGGWKLIHNTRRPAGTPEFELYDHGKRSARRARRGGGASRRRGEAWRGKKRPGGCGPPLRACLRTARASARSARRSASGLRALGYVQ